MSTDDRIKSYEEKAAKYLEKNSLVQDYYRIDEDGIFMFESPEAKTQNRPEIFLSWDEVKDFKFMVKHETREKSFAVYQAKGTQVLSKHYERPYDRGFITITDRSKVPLKDIKIALCPGHYGTNYQQAIREGKWIDMQYDGDERLPEPFQFYESDLTLRASYHLKEMLEEQGAIVMMVRDSNRTNALDIPFEIWMKDRFHIELDQDLASGEIDQEKFDYWKNKADTGAIMRHYFGAKERKARIKLINDFQPDIAVVMHFNVDETNKPWNKMTERNFNMAFVPGSLLPSELSTPMSRFDFLRMLITNQVPESIKLSNHILQSFTNELNVPAAGAEDATYLSTVSMATDQKGVYCRNLALTRGIQCPMVYGETLYQDNRTECQLLADPKSGRLKEVANSYFQGILNYANSRKFY